MLKGQPGDGLEVGNQKGKVCLLSVVGQSFAALVEFVIAKGCEVVPHLVCDLPTNGEW